MWALRKGQSSESDFYDASNFSVCELEICEFYCDVRNYAISALYCVKHRFRPQRLTNRNGDASQLSRAWKIILVLRAFFIHDKDKREKRTVKTLNRIKMIVVIYYDYLHDTTLWKKAETRLLLLSINYANMHRTPPPYFSAARALNLRNLNLRVYTRCLPNAGNTPAVKWTETMPPSAIIPSLINSSGHALRSLMYRWSIPIDRPETFCIYMHIRVAPRFLLFCANVSFRAFTIKKF